MIHIDTEIQINRDLLEVFHYVTNPQHYHQWNSAVISAELVSDKRISSGSKIKLIRNLHRQRTENVLQISDYIPWEKFAIKSINGPIPFMMEYYFNPLKKTTKIHVHAHLKARPLVSIFKGLVGKRVQSGIDKNLVRLKYLLENFQVSG